MTLQECYRILRLDTGADLDAVKSSFRRLAFQYHPDISSEPGANERFREVNEAYVTARKLLEETNGNATAHSTNQRAEKPTTSRSQGARAYSRQQRQKPKPPPEANSTRSRHQQFYYKEEEVLRTILGDPFARKVFEDIYSQIRKERPGYKGPLELKKRKLQLHFGNRTLSLDLARGFGETVKSWFKGQMDHEQTVFFPASTLIPGRKVRISVEQTFSDGPKTIEVTLPRDFMVGRPIRLKGLGRKLGPLKGDLLLKILAR
ncbi:DnaJ domain-containing protein [Pseudodesulfovibrio sp. F-1]|uniref:DnaJ domain-containing protein n=1 Tax=Pseudodesulfovibrio alkaliphilus TaxID=2661613 RepID=A0A7K1KLX0_9BACT|nr:DnaJ domain-containing protein [Pseudodesulfovibrio alkaliphilus]MUM77074.1 DnaJ domain-containing protein [Pseudodesulfovibrio alkaliphilus]